MAIILGVVFVIMVVMNGALLYVLCSAAGVTKRQISSCFVQELEDYNDYLNEKKAESDRLTEERDKLKKEISELESVILSLKTSPFYAPRPISRELFIPTARYIDNEFFDNHKLVNDMMGGVDKMEIVQKIRQKYVYKGNREEYEGACRLLEFLGMETAYELCTIPAPDQIRVLRESLTGQERMFLERFLEETGEEEFDVLKFRTYVREIRTAQDPVMYIRTGEVQADYSAGGADLVHQYDRNISEGLKIIYQNQSFDFSIYRLRSRK